MTALPDAYGATARAQSTSRTCSDLFAIRDWARLAAAALAEDERHAGLVAKAGELGLIALQRVTV